MEQIPQPIERPQPVDPQRATDMRSLVQGEEAGNGIACLRLVRACDGVFQIDANDVGTAAECLGISVQAICGHEQHRSRDQEGRVFYRHSLAPYFI